MPHAIPRNEAMTKRSGYFTRVTAVAVFMPSDGRRSKKTTAAAVKIG
jgi:hypothetical protein